MSTETLQWIKVADQMPDGDITVMLAWANDAREPEGGWYDGSAWRACMHGGTCPAPTHWAEWPEGPKC